MVTHGGERPRLAVSPFSAAAVEELYRTTGALEGLAARAAADRSVMDRRSLARTMALLDTAFRRAAAAAEKDWDEMFDRHDAFHRALQNACAGPHTRALLDALRPQIDRYEWFFAPLTGPDFSRTYAEHAAIVSAVRSGSADQIESTVRANWFKGAERLSRVIARADPGILNGDSWDKAFMLAESTGSVSGLHDASRVSTNSR